MKDSSESSILQKSTSYIEEIYCKVPFISGISFFLLSILTRASTLDSIREMNIYNMEPTDFMIPTFLGLSTYFIAKRLKIRKIREIFLYETYRQSTDTIILTDSQSNIIYINPAAEKFYDISHEDAKGKNVEIFDSKFTSSSTYAERIETLQRGKIWQGTFVYKDDLGNKRYEEAKIFSLKNKKGFITDYIRVQRDVTEKKLLEEQLEKLAKYDSLTGLLNRMHFYELGKFSLIESRRTGNPLSLLFIDLDDFKPVNDIYGHSLGDVVLKETASRFKNIIHRESDLVSRYGGDEFAILMSNTDVNNALRFAKNILDEIRHPYFIEDKEIKIGASIGIVSTPPIKLNSLEEMVGFADVAMYDAKRMGKNNYVVFQT